MNPYQDSADLRWDGVDFSVVRNLTMTSSNSSGGENGMEIRTGSANNVFSHITLNDIRNRGVEIRDTSSDNRFYDISINKTFSNYGFYASSSPGVIIEKFHGEDDANYSIFIISSPGSRISQAQIYHGANYGIYLSNFPHSTVVDAFISNIDNYGLYVRVSDNATLVNVTVAAGDNYGIHFSSSHDLTAVNLASAHNNSYGINTGGANNYFTGVLKITDNRSRSCSAGSSSGLADKSCAPQNGSDATLTSSGFTLQNAFVGKVDMNESVNASDSNGVALLNSITDSGSFENKFRGWGVNGAPSPRTITMKSARTAVRPAASGTGA